MPHILRSTLIVNFFVVSFSLLLFKSLNCYIKLCNFGPSLMKQNWAFNFKFEFIQICNYVVNKLHLVSSTKLIEKYNQKQH